MNSVELLKMHRKCKKEDLDYLQKEGERIEYSSDEGAKRIRKMLRSVGNEMHRMLAFIRLEQFNEILYGYAKFEHNIGPEVARRLARRTPQKIVVVGDEEKSFKAIYQNERFYAQKLAGIEKALEGFGVEKKSGGIKRLWNTYYWSQYAKGRKNLRLFGKNVPKKERIKTKSEMGEDLNFFMNQSRISPKQDNGR